MKALLLASVLFLSALAFLPGAAAEPNPLGEPQCMQVYRETTVGPVTIVQRDSCHSESYLCDRTLGEALGAPEPLDCLIG